MFRLTEKEWFDLHEKYKSGTPFDHIVVDNFFTDEQAEILAAHYPSFEDTTATRYSNAIELKRVVNHWDRFPASIYNTFIQLNSPEFVRNLELMTGINNLKTDIGLHGGGCHMHGNQGKLNIHMDYSIHPKLKLQRKLNIIIYMTKDWDPAWGGGLELWSHNPETNRPLECVTRVENKFNRAVIFDTTQNSWHGLPGAIDCPDGVVRRSFAAYYLVDPPTGTDPRSRALFAPTKEQENDKDVLDLIEKRSKPL